MSISNFGKMMKSHVDIIRQTSNKLSREIFTSLLLGIKWMQRDGTKEIENFYGAVAPIIHKGNEQEFWRPTRIPRPAIVLQSLKDNHTGGDSVNERSQVQDLPLTKKKKSSNHQK